MKIIRTLKQIRSMRLTRTRWGAIQDILKGRPTIWGSRIVYTDGTNGMTITHMSLWQCRVTDGEKVGIYGA